MLKKTGFGHLLKQFDDRKKIRLSDRSNIFSFGLQSPFYFLDFFHVFPKLLFTFNLTPLLLFAVIFVSELAAFKLCKTDFSIYRNQSIELM